MMRSTKLRLLLLATLLPGCGDDTAAMPDAAPPIPGDFDCVGEPLPTTAPDPVTIGGIAADKALDGVGAAAVEIHAVDDDALLDQTTSETAPAQLGRYEATLDTGGAALRVYRKLTAPGSVDAYGYDPDPITETSPDILTFVFTPAELDAFYAAAGVTRDPAKGTVWIDVHDCDLDAYLAGATVEAPSGSVFYLDDALEIDPALTATTSGSALILNVTPGEVDFTIHAGPIDYPSWPVGVHAGALTQLDRHP